MRMTLDYELSEGSIIKDMTLFHRIYQLVRIMLIIFMRGQTLVHVSDRHFSRPQSYVRGYSYPQQFYPSITLAVEHHELLDNHWTTDTILYNFAPSTYWKEYVKNYCHLRTMQIMREWSKEMIYYKYLDCEDPVDLSLPEKNRSTLPSSMAARLRLHPSKKNEENGKENYPPKANEKVKSGFKRRTIFNQKQLRELTRVFSTSKYISGKQRLRLAQQLGVSGTVVTTWFHNQRMKLKKLKDLSKRD
ncbi:Homeobox protein BarH-like 1 [Homalodisca vitripennis]|nr:Homeobox protein BarH-like 1 [Homalodisca vitripennis]